MPRLCRLANLFCTRASARIRIAKNTELAKAERSEGLRTATREPVFIAAAL